MKRKAFYHLCLSLPYIALLLTGAFTYLVNGFDVLSSPRPSSALLSTMLVFFTFSAMLWAPLYTWMVVVMLLWGRDKKPEEVRTLYFLSPALLACAMGFPALLVGLPDSGQFLLWGLLHMNNLDFVIPVLFQNFVVEQSMQVGLVWGFMASLCIVIGYVFVGIAVLVEKVMERRGLFVDEDPSDIFKNLPSSLVMQTSTPEADRDSENG